MPTVRFEVFTGTGDFVGDTAPQGPVVVWGGTTATQSATLAARLVSGDYLATVHMLPVPATPDGQTLMEPIQLEHAFTIGGLSGNAIPVCEAAPNAT
jgi:hypothetical protein